MSKKTLILIVALTLLLILGAVFYLFSSKKLSFPNKDNNYINPSSNLEKDASGASSGCAYCDGLTGESLAKCKTAIDCP